jgi:predicted metal-dependent hydrolase
VLGATVALEHWTAIMADFLLRHALGPNGGVFGTESARTSRFGLIWQWHACEETEHKAVAYDVFERYYGRGWQAYVSRCLSMLVSGLLFWTLAPVFTICLVAADGQLFNWAGWFQLLQVLLISPGMFWRILPAFCDYFRFDFHPWSGAAANCQPSANNAH